MPEADWGVSVDSKAEGDPMSRFGTRGFGGE